MSSPDALPLLTLLLPAFIALTAIASGSALVSRANNQRRYTEARFRNLLVRLPLASGVIHEAARLICYDHELEPKALWFAPIHATGKVIREVPADRLQPARTGTGRAVYGRQTYRLQCGICKICGAKSADAIIGMTLHELTLRSPVANEAASVMARIIRFTENCYVLENAHDEITLPDGTGFVSILNCRVVLKRGHLTHHWAMLLDLSEREAKIVDLQRSEARFERMAQ